MSRKKPAASDQSVAPKREMEILSFKPLGENSTAALFSVTRALAVDITQHRLCDVQARQLLMNRVRLGERHEEAFLPSRVLVKRVNRQYQQRQSC